MTVIDASIISFLKQLKKNNNREWFADHKEKFQEEQKKLKSFYELLQLEMEKHDAIEKLKIFRIYRDVRFSKDKTPYKVHMSGHFVREGKERRGGYYLHIQPGESFLAGGFWAPEKEDLFRIRKEFEMDTVEIREIISEENFQKYFGKIEGDSLKTAPRGFDKTHPDLDLIRMKQFIVTRKFTDKQITSANFLAEVNNSFKAMRPFFNYMSDVLTTNLNGESILD
ncbi:DUF2461 domain-containing protein [Lutibacter sp. TH_r2]|uniref:DUF2461 domain-containing protein n=1 Tax=Lutibacter sp. TH_r2 TaxID=3082083 RepID=UPI002952C009|nr:DUF2461 domain-containing protein [Lutibacter sp. TH_r2]MDV7187517.1 DUF2461 domain-containing protein [Lutibacter sp. TH_r2]